MTNQEYTGGSVSYYTCSVTHPINEQADPYDAECIDIIDALQMTPNEANAFKALWRRAAARLGKSKRGYTDGLYDAEKVEFYGKRLVELEQRERRVAGATQGTIDLWVETITADRVVPTSLVRGSTKRGRGYAPRWRRFAVQMRRCGSLAAVGKQLLVYA